jgi:hypothetical protein
VFKKISFDSLKKSLAQAKNESFYSLYQLLKTYLKKNLVRSLGIEKENAP